MTNLNQLSDQLRTFAAERDWDQFHTPKNLVMALAGEAGELVEHFQWLTPEASEAATLPPEILGEIQDEMADVLIYLVRLADRLNVDLLNAAEAKLFKNAKKYPVEAAKGNAIKYSRRDPE